MTLYADLPLGLLYSTVVIDPPWQYGDSLPGAGRDAAKHYPTLDLYEIGRLLLAPRGKHSRKPDEAYDVIRTISPAPRIDLFAREEREGFDVWGNEV